MARKIFLLIQELSLTTSKDLKNEIAIGNFREDLYHRLNVVPIEIPKLNSRTVRYSFIN